MVHIRLIFFMFSLSFLCYQCSKSLNANLAY
jgi:hypothetical protein